MPVLAGLLRVRVRVRVKVMPVLAGLLIHAQERDHTPNTYSRFKIQDSRFKIQDSREIKIS